MEKAAGQGLGGCFVYHSFTALIRIVSQGQSGNEEGRGLSLPVCSSGCFVKPSHKKKYGIDLNDLEMMKTIYLVRIEKNTVISAISPKQQELIDRLGLKLEV